MSVPSTDTNPQIARLRSKANEISDILLNPSDQTLQEVRKVIALQFNPNIFGEVGGRILRTADGLRLEPVSTDLDQHAFNCLLRFEANLDSGAAEYLAVELYCYSTAMSGEVPSGFQELNTLVRDAAIKPKNPNLQLTPDMATLLREIISSSYKITPKEIQADAGDFLGVFHVHPNGLAPNRGDIHAGQKLGVVQLIVAPQEKAASAGVKLYLVNGSEFEELPGLSAS